MKQNIFVAFGAFQLAIYMCGCRKLSAYQYENSGLIWRSWFKTLTDGYLEPERQITHTILTSFDMPSGKVWLKPLHQPHFEGSWIQLFIYLGFSFFFFTVNYFSKLPYMYVQNNYNMMFSSLNLQSRYKRISSKYIFLTLKQIFLTQLLSITCTYCCS